MSAETPAYDDPDASLQVLLDHPAAGFVGLAVVGEVDMASAPRLHDALAEAAADAPAHVLLDLSEVTFFSSAGVQELVAARERAVHQGFELHLTGTTDSHPAGRVLEIAGVLGCFRTHPSTADALAVIG